MARKKTTSAISDKSHHFTIDQKLNVWAGDTIAKILRNFRTQGIADVGEVYPGYMHSNAYRAHKKKYPDRGADSFRHIVREAAVKKLENDNYRSEELVAAHVDFLYDAYLRFVDMGVGKDRPIESVKRALDANHNHRYMASWDPANGSTQRPAIRMELRYRKNQLENHFEERYLHYTRMVIITSFDGLEIDLGI